MRSERRLAWREALLAAVLVAGLTWATASCADFHRGPAPVPVDGGADATTAPVNDFMFESAVYPILLQRCGGCHEGGASRLVLTGNARLDRAMVVALVVPGDPTKSELLIKATGGDAHPGGEQLATDSPEYAKLSDWIAMLPTGP